MSKQVLRVIPLGGLGEVGKNMTVFEYGDDAIIIDAGIMFPENDMLGIDFIIPDYKYLVENRHRLKIHALLVTHGHEDHTGAIPYLLKDVPVPVYGTSLTCGLVRIKLKDAGLKEHPVHVFKAGETLKFGPFTIESFHVTHSIPDCVGFGIRTPVGLVIHSGDYKFDHTPVDGWPSDLARIASLSQEGVLALLGDSTNADKPGWTPSESRIDPAFDIVFRDAPGRIIVATFASLISRIQQVANAGQDYGRKLAVAGYSMTQNIKIARKLGYLDIPDDMIISIEESQKLPPDQVVIMATGTQGEPSAVLGRLAYGTHRQLEVQPDDTIVMSSHPIPGNEEVVHRITNKLIQRGAHVIYDPKSQVHVSGHASQEEMKLLLNLVRPKFFVPVHGELRHLHSHADLAFELGIPSENIAVIENGQVLEFSKDTMTIAERVPGGYVFVDGAGIGDVGPAVLRDREALARDGFLMIVGVVDKKTGKMTKEPEIISRGFVYLGSAEELFESTRDLVREVASQSSNGSRDQQVQTAVKKMLYTETKRRPMVFAHIHEM
jgi:ribonuclease J